MSLQQNHKNLFLTGRIISVSHVAFGATRVMATSAYTGQAVAVAASLCRKYKKLPAELHSDKYLPLLQKELIKTGQYIPGIALNDEEDFVQQAHLETSSCLQFKGFNKKITYLNRLSQPLHKCFL